MQVGAAVEYTTALNFLQKTLKVSLKGALVRDGLEDPPVAAALPHDERRDRIPAPCDICDFITVPTSG